MCRHLWQWRAGGGQAPGALNHIIALKLKISVPAVSKSAIRGEKLAKARKYSLVG
jgi:hypothetical protein